MDNIQIAYILSFLWKSWFWLGIWILYYLRFTDYAGIGLLEAIMITTATFGEVPTGALADLVGKKWAVVIAFGLGCVGNFIMALAPNYWVLVVSIITMTIGGAFYSGAMEALIYDTLKEKGTENLYQRVIGKMNTMQNLGMALAGIVGGYLYTINIAWPFILVALMYFVGILLSLQLTEPIIDTEKFSIANFSRQTQQGFGQLFQNSDVAGQSLLLLVPGAIMVATENVLNDAIAVELGFSATKLGMLATMLYLFGAYVSSRSDWLMTRFSRNGLYLLLITMYVASLVLTPYLAMYAGALMLIIRLGIQTIFGNYTSVIVNENTESKYRATTLSTYNLIHNIPYVLTATGIGVLMNTYTARGFTLYLGLVVLILVMIMWGSRLRFIERPSVKLH